MGGFGDPNVGALGFGDPTPPSSFEDLGFGDPSELDFYYIDLETRNVYHTGGAEVRFKGVFLDDLAPYRAEIMVNNTPHFFHSGESGVSEELKPDRGVLTAYTPPAPVGVYSVVLRFGINYTQSVTLSIHYHADNRGLERYRLRELFPSHYKTGPRESSLDPLDQGQTLKEETTLEMVLDTIGRTFQEVSGAAQTVTRSFTQRGSTTLELESCLGLSAAGLVWVGRELLKYSHLNLSTHTLTLSEPLRVAIREHETVLNHAP